MLIKSRRTRWAEHITITGEKRNTYRILAGKSQRKRPTGKPGNRWEYNVTMHFKELG
jgi:hypothetical protein